MRYPYTKAFLGGALISIVPAFIVTLLSNLIPSTQSQNLEMVNSVFGAESYGFLQYFMLFCIIVVAPFIEEAIFRGALWNFMSRFLKEKTNNNSFCPRSCGSAARFGFDAAVFPAGLVQIPDGQLQGFSCVPYEQ